MTAAERQWTKVSRSLGTPGRREKANSSSPAMMNRAPDMRQRRERLDRDFGS